MLCTRLYLRVRRVTASGPLLGLVRLPSLRAFLAAGTRPYPSGPSALVFAARPAAPSAVRPRFAARLRCTRRRTRWHPENRRRRCCRVHVDLGPTCFVVRAG